MSFSDDKNQNTGFFMLAYQLVPTLGAIVRKIDCRSWICRKNFQCFSIFDRHKPLSGLQDRQRALQAFDINFMIEILH